MEKYDIFLSGGPACRPAYYLQKCELRKSAHPLDWQIYDLETGIHLYKTKFKDFFQEYKDLNKIHKGIRRVLDTKNKITSIHHIKAEKEIEVAVEEFRCLMQRRYKKLDDNLKKAESICILMNQKVSLEKIKKYLIDFSKIYPGKQITLINIRNRKNGKNKKFYEISKNLKIYEYFVNDIHADGLDPQTNKSYWHGNEEAWENILKEYAVNE